VKASIRFDGEGHKRPPEDQRGVVAVRQQTIWIDGVNDTARNDDGWLMITVETTDAVKGWALSYNGRDIPWAEDSQEPSS
jgi:hypothetical protein